MGRERGDQGDLETLNNRRRHRPQEKERERPTEDT